MDSVASRKFFKEKQMLKVTSPPYRATFYFVAITDSLAMLALSISALWNNLGTLHKLLYVVLLGATIPCVGLVVSCMLNEVPVAKYRLGAERRFNIYLATMISTFCVAYYSIDDDAFMEFCRLANMVIVGVVAIVQLHSPAQDFDPYRMVNVMYLGGGFPVLGRLASKSWIFFFPSLCCFIVVMAFVYSKCLESDEQERDRHHLHRPSSTLAGSLRF